MEDTETLKEETKEGDFKPVDLNEGSDGSVADVEEEGVEQEGAGRAKLKKKKRKKEVYFRSDFTGEPETDTDSDEDAEKNPAQNTFAIQNMNPKDLTWVMWFWYYIVFVSTSTFHAAEFCGEKLADFFGITSPKYQYVINEYHRLKEEEREEAEAERRAEEFLRQKEVERIAKLEGGDNSHPSTHGDQ